MNINSISSQNFNGLWVKGMKVQASNFNITKNGNRVETGEYERCFVNGYCPFADEDDATVKENLKAYKDNSGMFHVAILGSRLNITEDEFNNATPRELEEELIYPLNFDTVREAEEEFDFDDAYEASVII